MAKQPTFVIEQIQAQSQKFDAQLKTYEITEKYQPDAHFELDVKNRLVGDDRYEVTLSVVVDVKLKDKVVFNVAVSQAGLFHISGYENEREHILESFCPNILHPYAREVISSLVSKAGYPVFNLPPFDFETRYRQMKQGAEENKAE